MLVVTRKRGEDIIIGKGVRVRVLSVIAGRVKIGIEADRDVVIMRGEHVAENTRNGDAIVHD